MFRNSFEDIRRSNIDDNMAAALEFSPESFASVIMLYVDCQLNGVPLKCFVDSGAQMTIISYQCAERCGLARLIDTRWRGMARGVGSARILGRIHLTTMKLGNTYLDCSLSVLDAPDMELILGLGA